MQVHVHSSTRCKLYFGIDIVRRGREVNLLAPPFFSLAITTALFILAHCQINCIISKMCALALLNYSIKCWLDAG